MTRLFTENKACKKNLTEKRATEKFGLSNANCLSLPLFPLTRTSLKAHPHSMSSSPDLHQSVPGPETEKKGGKEKKGNREKVCFNVKADAKIHLFPLPSSRPRCYIQWIKG